jgi:amidase
MTSVLGEAPWEYDSKVIPMPWRYDIEEGVKAKLETGGLTVGFYNSDGNVSLLYLAKGYF